MFAQGLWISILAITIRAGTSLLFATIGEIFTERSGVLNLGVEGMMIMGAVCGFAAAFHTGNVWVGVVTAIIVGGLLALIHAFLTITLRADQTVSGLALTIFGSGLASFLGQKLGPGGKPLVGMIGPKFAKLPLPGLSQLPVIGMPLFQQDVLTYFLYGLVPVAWFYLYKTRPGLHLRAVGENPQTADAMGVHVTGIRYLYTVIGGMLVGLGGAHLSLAYTPGWTENLTAGRGWIAIALVIFSTWDPVRAVLGAVLFGGINAVQFRLQAAGTTIPAPFLGMLPYAFTVLVLVIITWWEAFSKRVGAPAALGLPYVREERV
ncbi:MAG: ABC transporter permease [Anaerolineae bacterium]|jgi:simple sugar transport system permease protein|nr:ABC transporter permease [Anaerolineae bacterium]MDH7473326.1 ABC transporter permease [Anaerolineae bacterium]